MHKYSTATSYQCLYFAFAILSTIITPQLKWIFSILSSDNILLKFLDNIFGLQLSCLGFFTFLIFVFSLVWKIPWVNRILKVPDLSGKWVCKGCGLKTNDNEMKKNEWNGIITIKQTPFKMSISLTTDNKKSRSFSLASTIIPDSPGNYKLMYIFMNEPIDSSNQLNMHKGYCELLFNTEKKTAYGSYYTSPERKSYGMMNLEKVEKK